MIDINLDYYLLQSDNKFMSPLLIKDYEANPNGPILQKVREIKDDTIYLTFGPPYPKKADMVDYLYAESRPVFSKKIYEVLKNKEIKGVKFIPTIVRDTDDNEYKDYWFTNIYQKYAFMDQQKSDKMHGPDPTSIRWSVVNKMIINSELINKVPLEERLIFAAAESTGYILYHKSIVDLIMSVNPDGLVFVPIDKWYNGIAYSL